MACGIAAIGPWKRPMIPSAESRWAEVPRVPDDLGTFRACPSLRTRDGVASMGGAVYIANSIVFGNGKGSLQGVSSSSYTHLMTSDPQFNNPTSDDFSLQAGSPAIDAGTNSVQGGLPFLDYSGRLRVASATGPAGQGTVDIGALEANSEYPLVYPLAANGSQPSIGGAFLTGIALLNPNASPAQVALTAYTGSGSVLSAPTNPDVQTLGAENQIPKYYHDLFGFDQNAAQMGSVLAASDSKLAGFSLIFDPAASLFSTGTNATSQTGTDLVFMRHESDANGTANYVISNPGVNTANITATLYNTTGLSVGLQQTATIVPKGQTVIHFNSSTLSSGYVRLQSDQPLSGDRVVGNSNRQAALGAFSPGSETRIFFPHYAAGGGYTTQVGIVNTGTICRKPDSYGL